MGAKAGRKGGNSYNIRTYGKGWWRKYLDKMRRKSVKREAIEEEMERWQEASAEAYWRTEENMEQIDGDFKQLASKTVEDSRDILDALSDSVEASGIGIDKEVVSLCEALNRIPGIQTTESCCGHGNSPYHIFFKIKNVKDLEPVCYFADSCHSGNTGWSVIARADCSMTLSSFLLEGPVGAYKASEDIARHINEWVDNLDADSYFSVEVRGGGGRAG